MMHSLWLASIQTWHLVPQKNILRASAAFAVIQNARPNTMLQITGSIRPMGMRRNRNARTQAVTTKEVAHTKLSTPDLLPWVDFRPLMGWMKFSRRDAWCPLPARNIEILLFLLRSGITGIS